MAQTHPRLLLLTAPNITPSENELVRGEIQEIKDALEAFQGCSRNRNSFESTGYCKDACRDAYYLMDHALAASVLLLGTCRTMRVV
jgi:hypothetical protein